MRCKPRSVSRVVYAGIALATLARATDLVPPNIKPGLWEVTNNPQISGQMPLPEDELAKMTPEQRARIQAAMQASMAKAAQSHVYQECMTPEKIAKGFDIHKQADDSTCQRNVVTSSAHELELHDECTKPDGKTVSDIHFQVSGGTSMKGQIHVILTRGGKTMTLNSSLEGKWLGSSCGDVKDMKIEK